VLGDGPRLLGVDELVAGGDEGEKCGRAEHGGGGRRGVG
jgi:hypothetical protein